jgi:hypothetical protein
MGRKSPSNPVASESPTFILRFIEISSFSAVMSVFNSFSRLVFVAFRVFDLRCSRSPRHRAVAFRQRRD